MNTDVGILNIITAFIWLVSWTTAIEILNGDLNNHPNKSTSDYNDTATSISDKYDDYDGFNVTTAPENSEDALSAVYPERTISDFSDHTPDLTTEEDSDNFNISTNTTKITVDLNSSFLNSTKLMCEHTFEYKDRTLQHCYDDRECRTYGDCCRNSTHYVEAEQTVSDNNSRRYKCRRVNGTGQVDGRLMIDQCPQTADSRIRDKCESNGDEDFVIGYPVTSADTGHVYRNTYCALCHGERGRVLYWKPTFRCGEPAIIDLSLEDVANGTLLYRAGRWYYPLFENGTLLDCRVELQRPDGVPELRPCVNIPLVDGCPANAPAKQARACAAYTYVMFKNWLTTTNTNNTEDVEERVFRNVDCALCNGVTANQLMCVPSYILLNKSGISDLFDINLLQMKQSCGPDEMYDVSGNVCPYVIRDQRRLAECRTYATLGFGEYGDVGDDGTVYVYAYQRRARILDLSLGIEPAAAVVKICADDDDDGDKQAEGQKPRSFEYAWFLMTAGVVGSGVSSVALLAHLALFCHRRCHEAGGKPINLTDKNLACLAGSLLLGYGSYLTIELNVVRPGLGLPCLASALAMQYGFLASFAWTFVMSVDVWLALRASTRKLRVARGRRNGRFAAYSAFAWLTPGAFVTLAAVLQLSVVSVLPGLRPHFQHDCWFGNPLSLIALFILPAGVVIIANYVSFVCVVRLIAAPDDHGWFRSADSSATTVCRARNDIKIYFRLSLMAGLSWVFGLIGAVAGNDVVWTVYTVLNSLQGTFLFVAFDCNRDAFAFCRRSGPRPAVSDTRSTTVKLLDAPVN